MPLTIEQLDALIAEKLTQPQSASVAGQSLTNYDLLDLIAARDKLAQRRSIGRRKGPPFRVTKMVTPGADDA